MTDEGQSPLSLNKEKGLSQGSLLSCDKHIDNYTWKMSNKVRALLQIKKVMSVNTQAMFLINDIKTTVTNLKGQKSPCCYARRHVYEIVAEG